ncbi:DUF2269 family protein [Lacisediminihabitans changchengi]|uniref:DUF2269 family protein n=1 Tax=Lacisediminihabitans changchengi TaxID=2787634 RepID=A0A934SJY8_9MICO|nr:DUF2269 family protein [Lacisediminihabitans changchengi]MBK4346963.1 DUF2269 family protein [Lacisediminihabitans changchengi]MBK4347914.1 DUF2269 family protein [Lacisediminihabitans changchengi]
MSTLLLVAHVVAAMFVIGPMAILPMMGLREVRAANAGRLDSISRATRLFSLLSLVVVVLGFGVLATARSKEQLTVLTPWVAASVIIYLVATSLSLFVTVPLLRNEADRLTSPQSTPHRSMRAYRAVAAASGATTLGLVAITVLMVWQP